MHHILYHIHMSIWSSCRDLWLVCHRKLFFIFYFDVNLALLYTPTDIYELNTVANINV